MFCWSPNPLILPPETCRFKPKTGSPSRSFHTFPFKQESFAINLSVLHSLSHSFTESIDPPNPLILPPQTCRFKPKTGSPSCSFNTFSFKQGSSTMNLFVLPSVSHSLIQSNALLIHQIPQSFLQKL